MRRLAAVAVLLASLLGCLAAAAQMPDGNPLQRRAPPAAAAAEAAPPAEPGLWQRATAEVRRQQGALQNRLAGLVRTLKEAPTWAAAGSLALASFLYGVFHAVGPGHGKVVITSYLAAREDQVRRGVLMSFLAAGVQGVTALLLVAVLAIALDMTGFGVTGSIRWLELVSYALIVGIGLWMAAGVLFGHRHDHGHRDHGHRDHDHAHHDHAHHDHGHHGHDHADGHGHMVLPAEVDAAGRTGSMWPIVLAIGLRPCSGAVIVLLFALAQGLLVAGVAATVAMSVGTALTVSALAVLTVVSRRTALRLAAAAGGGRWRAWAGRGLGLAGAFAVAGFGALLFASAWEATGPFY